MELQAGVDGQREHCKQEALDARELAKRMGKHYERELELAATAVSSLRALKGNSSDAQELAAEGPTQD